MVPIPDKQNFGSQRCVPCEGIVQPFDGSQIAHLMTMLDGPWTAVDDFDWAAKHGFPLCSSFDAPHMTLSTDPFETSSFTQSTKRTPSFSSV